MYIHTMYRYVGVDMAVSLSHCNLLHAATECSDPWDKSSSSCAVLCLLFLKQLLGIIATEDVNMC